MTDIKNVEDTKLVENDKHVTLKQYYKDYTCITTTLNGKFDSTYNELQELEPAIIVKRQDDSIVREIFYNDGMLHNPNGSAFRQRLLHDGNNTDIEAIEEFDVLIDPERKHKNKKISKITMSKECLKQYEFCLSYSEQSIDMWCINNMLRDGMSIVSVSKKCNQIMTYNEFYHNSILTNSIYYYPDGSRSETKRIDNANYFSLDKLYEHKRYNSSGQLNNCINDLGGFTYGHMISNHSYNDGKYTTYGASYVNGLRHCVKSGNSSVAGEGWYNCANERLKHYINGIEIEANCCQICNK